MCDVKSTIVYMNPSAIKRYHKDLTGSNLKDCHNAENRKWFAVVMDISKRKLGLDSDEVVDIMNLKCDPVLVASLITEVGFFPAYHMVKGKWITIMLDSVDDERIKWLLGMSFELTMKR